MCVDQCLSQHQLHHFQLLLFLRKPSFKGYHHEFMGPGTQPELRLCTRTQSKAWHKIRSFRECLLNKLPSGRPASAPTLRDEDLTLSQHWERSPCYKTLSGTELNLLPNSLLSLSFKNMARMVGRRSSPTPLCAHSLGPESSLPYSVAILARRTDGFLRLVEPTFTDTCCMDTHRDVQTQSHNHKLTHSQEHTRHLGPWKHIKPHKSAHRY